MEFEPFTARSTLQGMLRDGRTRLFFSFVWVIIGGAFVHGEVALAPLFTDHMVLQSGQPLTIWGQAKAGETLTVTFAGTTVSGRTSADGTWSVILPAQPPSSQGRELVVSGETILR